MTNLQRPSIEDVQRRWRFVPKFIKRWFFYDNMIWQLNFYEEELPSIYTTITGNRLSYPWYDAETVIGVYEDYLEQLKEEWAEEAYEEIREKILNEMSETS